MQIFYDYLSQSLVAAPGGADQVEARVLRDTTQVDFSKPLQVSYIGPSITPLTGLNAGYRVYQVDSKTFSVLGAQTYFANISNSLQWKRPVWEFEYDTRQAYTANSDAGSDNQDSEIGYGIKWPSSHPLNATFWHQLTQQMLRDARSDAVESKSSRLLDLYETYESKSSTFPERRVSGGAVSVEQKVCFIRAGSSWLGKECKKKYNSDARSDRERAFGIR
jgi:sphingomyelin phosphodiesterase